MGGMKESGEDESEDEGWRLFGMLVGEGWKCVGVAGF